MKRIIFIITILTIFFSCSKKNEFEVDVSKIEATLKVERFEQFFYTAKVSDLPKLKEDFSAIFPVNIPDSVWISKMNNKDEQELFKAVQDVYPNLNKEISQLENLVKHIKYYYPKFEEPNVITVIRNVPIDQKIILDTKTLYISLDVFLGVESYIYSDYPDYIKQNLTKEQLIVEVAKTFAEQTQFRNVNRTFVSRMIQKGKLLYTLDAFLPKVSNANKISYTKEQLDWVNENQEMIWRYFIEKKLIYSTDSKLDRRFLDEAPFSKFYLDIDSESPGRVGEWFGWQIVKAFMENNKKVSFKEMLKLDNAEIFKKSKYKPKQS